MIYTRLGKWYPLSASTADGFSRRYTAPKYYVIKNIYVLYETGNKFDIRGGDDYPNTPKIKNKTRPLQPVVTEEDPEYKLRNGLVMHPPLGARYITGDA